MIHRILDVALLIELFLFAIFLLTRKRLERKIARRRLRKDGCTCLFGEGHTYIYDDCPLYEKHLEAIRELRKKVQYRFSGKIQ